jgi:hypothetical protein
MLVRFFIDPDTELPHTFEHGVAPEEVLDVLRGPAQIMGLPRKEPVWPRGRLVVAGICEWSTGKTKWTAHSS